MVASRNPSDFFPVGTTTVTYTATDASGNQTVCSFDVTVFTVDSDNDGTCDEYDLCPGGPEPNTPCDDGDPNTFNDVINFACVCQGIPFIDLELVGMLEGPYVVVNDMMKDDLRAKGLNVAVDQTCASACIDVLAGGVSRYIVSGARIGIHQSSAPSTVGSHNTGQSYVAGSALYLREMGVDPDLALAAASVPPNKMYWIAAQEAIKTGLATEVVRSL